MPPAARHHSAAGQPRAEDEGGAAGGGGGRGGGRGAAAHATAATSATAAAAAASSSFDPNYPILGKCSRVHCRLFSIIVLLQISPHELAGYFNFKIPTKWLAREPYLLRPQCRPVASPLTPISSPPALVIKPASSAVPPTPPPVAMQFRRCWRRRAHLLPPDPERDTTPRVGAAFQADIPELQSDARSAAFLTADPAVRVWDPSVSVSLETRSPCGPLQV